ncbi:MOSC domain-containing protein [Rhodobacteraceae bacterium 2CG4]|uniref:MOSC domain-containing protein n=1 Tax=Halovulum marinum TaxID=2662447 RepID=A0A6L5Z6D2_9RHOB|nr:MOSC N-terminal beta barrel domain-containing protein [Halovulum marinum]MSU91605.1 MOSC domain-containing protein [Halovulum marinum]
MPRLARIDRHPIKSLGVESVERARLSPGATLPWDRVWALAHEAAKLTGGWVPCANFIRVTKSPRLMAITARTDEDTGRITLTHPDRPQITVDPDTDSDALVDWVRPLTDAARAAPSHIVRAGVGMTDSPYPSISVLNSASLAALSGRAGKPLNPRRFRGNLLLDGAAPWAEFDWIGRTLRIGEAELEVRERITRCLATHVDPETGARDTDVLGTLRGGWDHADFGVYAVVTRGGVIARGDEVNLS